MSDKSKSSISFGFKKKIETKVDESKVIKEANDQVEKESLDEIDKDTLHKVPKKKELIIPLIKKNNWNISTNKDSNGKQTEDESTDLEAKAAREIMKESAAFLETSIPEEPDKQFENLAVPLLLKNKVPDGFETDDKLDVGIRPDEASLQDYEAIPIEAFGMAMLRGMGWDPKVGIGKTFKENVKVLETTLRPKGLGLGASAPNPREKDKKNNPSAKEDTTLEVKLGAYVKVLSGSNKKKYGVVDGIDPDNALCVVKFALGGKTAAVGHFNLEVVSKKEFLKYGKDLSRLTKAHDDSERRKETKNHNYHDSSNSERLSSDKSSRERHSQQKKRHSSPADAYGKDGDFQRENGHKHQKRKRLQESPSRDQDHHEKKKKHYKEKHRKHKKEKKRRHSDSEDDFDDVSKANAESRTWLLSNLRVRMVDQSYKKGKYYREKMLVVDVFDSKGHCCCKTESGMLLDDLREDMLETVLPRSSSDAYVVITSGGKSKHDGKLARILEKDKENCEAYLQLIEDRDVALRVGFDDICEYAGDIEAMDQF